jgi:hypothetical protein
MTTIDLNAKTDEQLAELLNGVLAEQERRQRLRVIPEQITTLAAQFIQGGGDANALTSALGEALPA